MDAELKWLIIIGAIGLGTLETIYGLKHRKKLTVVLQECSIGLLAITGVIGTYHYLPQPSPAQAVANYSALKYRVSKSPRLIK